MRTLSTATCSALVLGLFVSGQAHAGAWTKNTGEGYFELSGSFLRSDNFNEVVDGDQGTETHHTAIPTLTDYTLNFYGEYGLHKYVTLVASLPLLRRVTLNRQVFRRTLETVPGADGAQNNNIGDAEAGARLKLLSMAGIALSGEFKIGIPTGDSADPNGLNTGDGEWNALGSFLAGYSFSTIPVYMTGEATLNLRTSGFSEEVRYLVEAGWSPIENLSIAGRIRGVESFRNGDSEFLGMTGGNEIRYTAIEPLVAYKFGGFGVVAKATFNTRVQNTVTGSSVGLGIFLDI